MATWTGWVAQLLSAAGIPNTSGTRRWMDDWSTNSISDCRNNPVDVSAKVGSSSNCKRLTPSRQAQNYASHSQAATAFSREIHSGNFPHLLAALQKGTYPTPAELGGVETDLQIWGSLNFVVFLENTFGISPGGGGVGGAGTYAPRATKGWNDIRQAINHGLPTALRKIGGLNRATSNSLARRSRVRH